MKKQILIRKTEDGKVGSVATIDHMMSRHKKTREEIIELVKNNKEWQLEEVNEDDYNAFKFLLGEEEYRVTYTISGLYEDIDNVDDALEDNARRLDDCFEELRDIKQSQNE